ncbi:MAG TPA: hypothetical protein VFX50_06875, partial [Gemmatimonadales bacterium]|nr:hypothetical protein [Gemmatimonadales bacterium]
MSPVLPPLPMGAVLGVTTATQVFTTLGALALAAVAPEAAARLGVSGALIGYQVGLVYFGAMLAAPFGGGIVARLGAVRTSQVSLWLVAAGLATCALGTVPLVVLGTFLMGLGYGTPSPAASH